jgi:hypothetical protein
MKVKKDGTAQWSQTPPEILPEARYPGDLSKDDDSDGAAFHHTTHREDEVVIAHTRITRAGQVEVVKTTRIYKTKAEPMTTEEVMHHLASDSLLNQVRRKISSHTGKVEQAMQQVKHLSPVALRKMEFEAAIEIAATLGIDLTPGAQPPTGVRGAIGPKGPTGPSIEDKE